MHIFICGHHHHQDILTIQILLTLTIYPHWASLFVSLLDGIQYLYRTDDCKFCKKCYIICIVNVCHNFWGISFTSCPFLVWNYCSFIRSTNVHEMKRWKGLTVYVCLYVSMCMLVPVKIYRKYKRFIELIYSEVFEVTKRCFSKSLITLFASLSTTMAYQRQNTFVKISSNVIQYMEKQTHAFFWEY